LHRLCLDWLIMASISEVPAWLHGVWHRDYICRSAEPGGTLGSENAAVYVTYVQTPWAFVDIRRPKDPVTGSEGTLAFGGVATVAPPPEDSPAAGIVSWHACLSLDPFEGDSVVKWADAEAGKPQATEDIGVFELKDESTHTYMEEAPDKTLLQQWVREHDGNGRFLALRRGTSLLVLAGASFAVAHDDRDADGSGRHMYVAGSVSESHWTIDVSASFRPQEGTELILPGAAEEWLQLFGSTVVLNDLPLLRFAAGTAKEKLASEVQDVMACHVLWSSSTEKAMAIRNRHPHRGHVRLETDSWSSHGSTSSSRQSLSKGSDLTSDIELAIPIERPQVKHAVTNLEIGKCPKAMKHMWWYDDDDDDISSSQTYFTGDGPSYITDDGDERLREDHKRQTGAQTAASGSDEAGSDFRICSDHLQMVTNGPESGFQSGSTQEPAEKQKQPKQTQPQRQQLDARECVIVDVVKSIQHQLMSSGPDEGGEEPVGADTQSPKRQGKSDVDLSCFKEEQRQMANTMSREEIMAVVPVDENGQPTSIGSMLHASATCRLCAFPANQCKSGVYCFYCHLKHNCKQRKARRSKMRMGKSQREQVREKVESLVEQIESDTSLDLDQLDIPKSLLDCADVIKPRLRSYQHGLLMESSKLSL